MKSADAAPGVADDRALGGCVRKTRSDELKESPYMSVRETAVFIRKTEKGVYGLIARGLLPGVRRAGRSILVNRAELVAWLEKAA
jgi:excisionase family DNA binding protein